MTWFKWDYVCPDCDSHIEMTSESDGHSHDSYCLKCAGDLVLMSVLDVTIPSIPTKKEDKMDTVLETPYIPSMLVKYKKITNGEPEYITDKVTDIEWHLERGRSSIKAYSDIQNKVYTLENIITSKFADSDDQETLTEIAELFGFELTKEVEVTGTISFTATVRVSLTDDFDIDSIVANELNVNSYGDSVDVNEWSLDDVNEF